MWRTSRADERADDVFTPSQLRAHGIVSTTHTHTQALTNTHLVWSMGCMFRRRRKGAGEKVTPMTSNSAAEGKNEQSSTAHNGGGGHIPPERCSCSRATKSIEAFKLSIHTWTNRTRTGTSYHRLAHVLTQTHGQQILRVDYRDRSHSLWKCTQQRRKGKRDAIDSYFRQVFEPAEDWNWENACSSEKKWVRDEDEESLCVCVPHWERERKWHATKLATLGMLELVLNYLTLQSSSKCSRQVSSRDSENTSRTRSRWEREREKERDLGRQTWRERGRWKGTCIGARS